MIYTKLISISILFILSIKSSFSQEHKNLQEINTQIWEPFSKAFETSDHQLFASLHSDNLIRVGADGNQILNKEDYIKGYKASWETNNQKRTIAFRFLERLATNDRASERGIYKLTINPESTNEQSYYGKFHVILTKESGTWKILLDYDSSEGNTIDEISYKKCI